jgi:hypothetical protein
LKQMPRIGVSFGDRSIAPSRSYYHALLHELC